MSKLIVLALVVVSCGVAYSQFDLHGYPQMERVVKTICAPGGLTPKRKHIVDECNKLIPSFARSGFSGCVREVMRISKLTKPAVCYRAGPGGEKLTPCLQRKAKQGAKRLPPGIDIKAMREQVIQQYQSCMVKVL